MTIDTDLATLPFVIEQRGTMRDGRPITCLVWGDGVRSASDPEVMMWERLKRVEAELARLREERDALAEASPFPVETVMSWKRQVDDAKRRSASVLLLLDPERQDEPDEENARRAFEILSGLRPPTFRPDRERADAAEARCARLQQALREIEQIDERDDSRPTFFGLQNAFFKAQRIAREALAGPDTLTAGDQGVAPDGTGRVAPADGCAERQSTADPSPAASEEPA